MSNVWSSYKKGLILPLSLIIGLLNDNTTQQIMMCETFASVKFDL